MPPCLPADALARWRALEQRRDDVVDPVARVRHWLERLRARMLCSSGRLGPLLLDMGLCDLGAIAACVMAQLDAGTAGDGQLVTDVDADIDVLVERGPLDLVEELSRRVARVDWLPNTTGYLEADLARRLLDAGREKECEEALLRITWHGPLLRWLRDNQEALRPETRVRLLARAEDLVATADVRPEFQVAPFVELGEVSGNRTWVDRASEILSTLSPEQIEATGWPDPVADVACALAGLGAFDDAMATIATLPQDERWEVLVRLVPMAPGPATRAALIEEIVASRKHFEGRWWLVIEAAPEVAERVLALIEAMPDEERRLEHLSAVVEHVDHERARELCAWMLRFAERDRAPASWTRIWGCVLDALTEAGCEALVDDDRRRKLVDVLLADPERDLWTSIARYVPDDRASEVLEVSCARLAVAAHYTERDKWIAVGLAVLARVPPKEAARWREIAAAQMAGTGIEGCGLERFASWSAAQQRGIVLARLAHHQQEFLPHWLLEPWAQAARQQRAIGFAADPEARAEARRALATLTATTAWPTLEQVRAVLDALERCAGVDAVASIEW
jgi:hypothetical protein